ncbi:MAG: low molecular weight phosphatase family protein [Candidatus Aenigmarchaeota archaeon]|nr:low molecular weight phosphatase family protein [Candidatus Aenigmarchaeota archaeon]
MNKILFVCMGNVFRSQIAEAYYNFYTGCDYAKSAGLRPQDNVNNYIPETVKEAMLEVGIDMQGQPKALSKSAMGEADYIIAMDRRIPAELPPEYAGKIILWDTRDTTADKRNDIREIRDFIIGNVEKFINM